MPFSLHAALVPSWLQILGASRGLVAKAANFADEQGIEPQDLIGAKLAPDMLPLAFQIKSCCAHSRGAVEGVRSGEFSPDRSPLPASFAELDERLEDAMAFLAALDPAELDGVIGRDVVFSVPNIVRREYTAENFLLGFSQPNFFFHATTAYDILRMKGVPLGKGDFLGATPTKN